MIIAKKTPDLSFSDFKNAVTYDGEPLFSNEHRYKCGRVNGTQCNYFSGRFSENLDTLAEAVQEFSERTSRVKDENGEAMDFVPNIIFVPRNRERLHDMLKAARVMQMIVVLQDWDSERDEMILADDLAIGFWFCRKAELDHRTGRWFKGWIGWKGVTLVIDSDTPVEGTEFCVF